MPSRLRLFIPGLISIMLTPAVVLAQQEKQNETLNIAERLATPNGWRTEVIKLPPPFAPKMKLKGEEHIRFAPGMFNAEANDFFSYVFVFEFPEQEKLTSDRIQEELLAYYRGLSMAVWKKKDVPLKVETFQFELKEINRPEGETVGSFFTGDLAWKEPFVTSADQTLHMEVQSWNDSKSGKAYLLICVSPKDPKTEIWKKMREIRAKFHQ